MARSCALLLYFMFLIEVLYLDFYIAVFKNVFCVFFAIIRFSNLFAKMSMTYSADLNYPDKTNKT